MHDWIDKQRGEKNDVNQHKCKLKYDYHAEYNLSSTKWNKTK